MQRENVHISEGVLSAPVLAAGAGLAVAGLAVGIKKTKEDDVPRVALLSAAFFVASLVHVPIGPTSVHLILNGINGMILGWAAFPAIFVALALQAVLFQFGGLTTLGVNTVMMAAPAVLCRYVFYPFIKRPGPAAVASFAAGALSVAMSGVILALALVTTSEDFLTTAKAALAAHVPVMLIEGAVTAVCVSFLLKVKPEIFGVAK